MEAIQLGKQLAGQPRATALGRGKGVLNKPSEDTEPPKQSIRIRCTRDDAPYILLIRRIVTRQEGK